MVAYSFFESDARILQYTSALIQRGDQVDVIALRREGQAKHAVDNGVNIHRIQNRRVNERGPLSYFWRILRFLVHSTFTLAKNHLANPYDLIHVHSVPDILVFSAIVPKILGTPVILDIHDILPEFYASKFQARRESVLFKVLLLIERWSIAFSNHVIIANHIWRDRLLSRSAKPAKCTAICNYPDPRLFSPRPKQTTDHRFIILYPGSLNSHQGLDLAVRAFARVSDRMLNAEFHIYGQGPCKPSLIELARQLGLGAKVVFHDFLPLNEIAQVMANADLAVVPKRAESEFGNEAASTKILQFMSLGVPVLVSRTRVDTYYYSEDMVQFFQSHDEAELAQNLLLLMQDRELRERLRANATQYVRQNNWDVKKQEYLDIVDSLVVERHVSRIGDSPRSEM
jgi:glycosyltransferase involved in cell wall biosynthesis